MLLCCLSLASSISGVTDVQATKELLVLEKARLLDPHVMAHGAEHTLTMPTMYDPGFVELTPHPLVVTSYIKGAELWAAVTSDYQQGGTVGHGATKEDAIADLMRQMGSTCEQVANELVCHGFSDAQVAQLMEK